VDWHFRKTFERHFQGELEMQATKTDEYFHPWMEELQEVVERMNNVGDIEELFKIVFE